MSTKMSGALSSTDLSDFFSDDDSEGLRFVNFIKQKRKDVRKQKYLFMDCETDRMSFEVQLEKLPTPQLKKVESKKGTSGKANEKTSDAQLPSDAPAVVNFEISKSPRRSAGIQQHADVVNTSPIQSRRSNRPTIRKSTGVFSPSDRLRRFSIKNYSAKKTAGGRRTLLQEFESTVGDTNFNPPTFSTPILQPTQNVPQPSLITNNLAQNEDMEANIANKTSTGESCCGHTDTLIKTLLRKDAELKDYMGNILDKTLKTIEGQSKALQNSSAGNATISDSTRSKRTFTVETGNVPGQIVLTPDRRNSQITNSQQSPKPTNRTKTDVSKSQLSCQDCCSLLQRGVSKILNSHSKKQGCQAAELQTNQNENFEIPNSSHNSLPDIFPTQNVVIPETQTQSNAVDNTIQFASAVSQVTGKISGLGQDNVNSKRPQINNHTSTVQNIQQTEDNLKLADVLTDDEDTTPNSTLQQSAQHATEKPLNLAPTPHRLRKKGRRKCIFTKQKLRKDNSQKLTAETEMEMAPPRGTRPRLRRNYKPLNSPPGTPLNGEMYAKELARMSNYEILDLRKRNSMGQIYVISGRRSRRSLEEVNKKKHQLDDQIERELLKRNLENRVQHSIYQLDQENYEYGSLPVPYNFRDSTTEKSDQNILKDSSFIDEKLSDRVKFKSNKTKDRLSKEKILPEVLKQYLEVSERYSQYSQRKRQCSNNTTKRSLANTQGINESYQRNSLTKRTSCPRLKLNVPYTKSPQPFVTLTSEMQNTPTETHRRTVATNTTRDKIQKTPEKVRADIVAYSTTTDDIQTTPPEIHRRKVATNTTRGTMQKTTEKLHADVVACSTTTDDVQTSPPETHRRTVATNTTRGKIQKTLEKVHADVVACSTITDDIQTSPPETHRRTVGTNTTRGTMQKTTEKLHADVVACSTTTDEIQTARNKTHSDAYENLTLPPPPPGFESDSGTSPNKTSNQYTSNVTRLVGTKNDSLHTNFNAYNDDNVFKKPVNPPSKRKYRKKDKIVKSTHDGSAVNNQGSNDVNGNGDLVAGSSLRRSKRGQVPITIPNILVVFQEQEIKRQERIMKAREIRKQKKLEEEKNMKKLNKTKTKTKTKETKSTRKTKHTSVEINNSENENLGESTLSKKNSQCNRLEFDRPPPIAYLNNVFDQLKQNNLTDKTTVSAAKPQTAVKPLKIRVRRLAPSETVSTTGSSTVGSTTVSSTSSFSSTNSNIEYISWLKNLGNQHTSAAFKDTRISCSTNLRFTELQGLEYAFYDTPDSASLGYLRFKPRQCKTRKKAKHFQLNFINLLGLFRVTVNQDDNILAVGDAIVIEKLAYYDIENLTDDMSILMVIKK